jgi:hypothetical protein
MPTATLPPGVIDVARLLLLESFALEDRLYAYATVGATGLPTLEYQSAGIAADLVQLRQNQSKEDLL